MSIETELKTKLSGNTALSTACGGKIFAVLSRQPLPDKFIVFELAGFSSDDSQDEDGPESGDGTHTFNLTAYAKTYEDSLALAALVGPAIHAGTWGAIKIQRCVLINKIDTYNYDPEQVENLRYGRKLTFQITF